MSEGYKKENNYRENRAHNKGGSDMDHHSGQRDLIGSAKRAKDRHEASRGSGVAGSSAGVTTDHRGMTHRPREKKVFGDRVGMEKYRVKFENVRFREFTVKRLLRRGEIC